MSASAIRHRITLKIDIDLSPQEPGVGDSRLELELAAADAIELARDRIEEKTSARIRAYAMRSTSALVVRREHEALEA